VLCEFTRENKSNTNVIVSMMWHKKMDLETHEVWISRDEMVDFLLYAASLEASVATRSKMSRYWVSYLKMGSYVAGTCIPLTKEFRIDMARLEIPVSGWTCLRTKIEKLAKITKWETRLGIEG
jgi:hypothetical protein